MGRVGRGVRQVRVRQVGRYGLRLFRNGVELRGDGRRRFLRGRASEWGVEYSKRPHGYRGRIGGWSEASARRLAFVAANVDSEFKSLLTLTYRARAETWECDADRNRRIIQRAQADRHRFLRCLADELGAYLWVREFQSRGVVHYHVISERQVTQERATEAWCRASGQLGDAAVMRHGVRVDAIRSQGGALSYLARYLGKERQKQLPPGVEGAGRWWGRSRSLSLAALDEVVWLDRSNGIRKEVELRIVRILRRYVSRWTGRAYRGGAFLDYSGKLPAILVEMLATLRVHYGETPAIDPMALPVREAEEWEVRSAT